MTSHSFLLQGNRRCAHGVVLGLWHDHPIPHDMHRLSYPRVHAIMGTYPRHPLRRPYPHALSQGFASPLLAHEREQTGIAATIIDRSIAAIATVKTFNAAEMESERANASFLRLKKAATMLNRVWGTTLASHNS